MSYCKRLNCVFGRLKETVHNHLKSFEFSTIGTVLVRVWSKTYMTCIDTYIYAISGYRHGCFGVEM
jgi:hypothetical protein